MAIDLQAAEQYFTENIANNDVWVNADSDQKQRALNNAANTLSRRYPNRTISDEAIFEQAFWILKISEARKQSEQGITSYSIDGISVSLSQIDRSISPEVFAILGRRFGTSQSGRQGYIVSNHARKPSGGVDL